MSEPVTACPTCPEGWRPLDKEHCADCYEGRIERLLGEVSRLKVELACRNLRITGLEETLKRTREQLIKVRDADPELRKHQLETNQVIASAWRMLNFDERYSGPAFEPNGDC